MISRHDDIASSVAEEQKLIKQILSIMDTGGFWDHKVSASNSMMVDKIPPNQVDLSRRASVLGLKLDHNSNKSLSKIQGL